MVNIDPPYYAKGPELYTSFYQPEDHVNLARAVRSIKQPWMVTYDDVPEIRTVSADALLTPPTQPDRSAQPFIAALLPIDGKMGGLIEVPTLLSIVERG